MHDMLPKNTLLSVWMQCDEPYYAKDDKTWNIWFLSCVEKAISCNFMKKDDIEDDMKLKTSWKCAYYVLTSPYKYVPNFTLSHAHLINIHGGNQKQVRQHMFVDFVVVVDFVVDFVDFNSCLLRHRVYKLFLMISPLSPN